jgi:hypothetical protein
MTVAYLHELILDMFGLMCVCLQMQKDYCIVYSFENCIKFEICTMLCMNMLILTALLKDDTMVVSPLYSDLLQLIFEILIINKKQWIINTPWAFIIDY